MKTGNILDNRSETVFFRDGKRSHVVVAVEEGDFLEAQLMGKPPRSARDNGGRKRPRRLLKHNAASVEASRIVKYIDS